MSKSIDQYYLERWGNYKDWKKIGNSKKKRLQNFINLKNKYLNACYNLNTLDFGCGSGWFLLHLNELGFNNLYGYDVTPSTLTILKNNYSFISKVYGLKGRGPNEIPEEYFDICISSEVYEHVNFDHKLDYLHQINKTIKDKGYLYLTTPNGNYKNSGLKTKNHQPIEDWSSPKRVIKELKDSGFEIIEKGSFHLSPEFSYKHMILFGYSITKLTDYLNLRTTYEAFFERQMLGLSTYYFCRKR